MGKGKDKQRRKKRAAKRRTVPGAAFGTKYKDAMLPKDLGGVAGEEAAS